ncbi:copper chaperone PCu(A)C [Streptomyces sp. NPDC019645]|uniref:copper chaperone PCu(A)C n=1 Tax=Streptomyces sp. NPDC019645 TaxID=3154786 RepID=UPI0033DB50D3
MSRERRGLTDVLPAVLAPLAACAVALGGLTTWVGTGSAGTPPRIDVVPGRVLLPYGADRDTAAYFEVANSGGSADRLTGATSPSARGEITLTRHRGTDAGAAYRDTISSAAVPAGSALSMSPHGVSLAFRPEGRWRAGDIVPMTLHFEHGGQVRTVAVVVGRASASR